MHHSSQQSGGTNGSCRATSRDPLRDCIFHQSAWQRRRGLGNAPSTRQVFLAAFLSVPRVRGETPLNCHPSVCPCLLPCSWHRSFQIVVSCNACHSCTWSRLQVSLIYVILLLKFWFHPYTNLAPCFALFCMFMRDSQYPLAWNCRTGYMFYPSS